MFNRLYEVVNKLLIDKDYQTVDSILHHIDIQSTGNNFNDLIDLTLLCNSHYTNLPHLGYFKKELVDKIYYERGVDGTRLINKILDIEKK